MYPERIPLHLREDLIYIFWNQLPDEQKKEREEVGLPVPIETKGERMYRKAEEYLDSKGFMNCDMGNYFPTKRLFGSHGIGIASPDKGISICFVNGETFEKSPYVDCLTVGAMLKTLDLLISVCLDTQYGQEEEENYLVD